MPVFGFSGSFHLDSQVSVEVPFSPRLSLSVHRPSGHGPTAQLGWHTFAPFNERDREHTTHTTHTTIVSKVD